jgi:3-oxoacyl-[acyl-carrier protein] reductase
LQLLTITPIELTTTLLTGMRSRGYGRVIAILSSGVREPIESLAYSNAGRAALSAWLKTVSRTAASDGVTVNGVLPGRIATPRVESLDRARAESEGSEIELVRLQSYAAIPVGRYGEPDEFASAVAYLASDGASYMTGSTLTCDGGMGRSLP